MTKITKRLSWAGILFVGLIISSLLAQGDDIHKGLGVAITPRNFPKQTDKDLNEAFQLGNDLGRYAVLIFQWDDDCERSAKLMVNKARANGLTPILALSPTSLDNKRQDLQMPKPVRKKAKGNISFANPAVRNEFKNTAKAFAQLRPDYLCLATEINSLAKDRKYEYDQFASLYKETYHEVKTISPGTKVFVSFSYDWLRRLDVDEPLKLKDHTELIDKFRSDLDLIALTSYPFYTYDSPGRVPFDYYFGIKRHLEKDDELMFMEIGWPSRGKGSERDQVAFIKRLPALFNGLNVRMVAWPLLFDVDRPGFDENLSSIGLIKQTGEKKDGYDAFHDLGDKF